MGVLCSDWVIQHSLSAFSDNGGVPGPSDSGSRSTSGDTAEDELIVSLNYCYTTENSNVTFRSNGGHGEGGRGGRGGNKSLAHAQ